MNSRPSILCGTATSPQALYPKYIPKSQTAVSNARCAKTPTFPCVALETRPSILVHHMTGRSILTKHTTTAALTAHPLEAFEYVRVPAFAGSKPVDPEVGPEVPKSMPREPGLGG